MPRPSRPISRKKPPLICPFCKERTPRLRRIEDVFSFEGCRGGRCECGAVFVRDESGKNGGETLLDALALACDGDTSRALTLRAKVDYRIAVVPEPGRRVTPQSTQPRIWFIVLRRDDRLLEETPDSGDPTASNR